MGKGSTFWLTAWVKPAVSAELVSTRRLRDLRKLPVLVVDDSAVMREVVCDLIETWKGEPTGACDAATAYERLQAAARAGKPFAVAVVDWNHPN